MTELREKVARAMLLGANNHRNETIDFDGMEDDDKELMCVAADAAIATVMEALRLPSAEMIERGGRAFGDAFGDMPLHFDDDQSAAAKIWQAMLSAFKGTDNGQ